MTPQPISVPLTSPATPVTFELQGTGEIDIKSIVATWDGSGAGAAFYPVISIYTSDNRLMSRTRTTDTVAAGSSVVATFAPFLRKPSAGTGGGGKSSRSLAVRFADLTLTENTWTIVTFALLGGDAPVTTPDDISFLLDEGSTFGYWVCNGYAIFPDNAFPTPTAIYCVVSDSEFGNPADPVNAFARGGSIEYTGVQNQSIFASRLVAGANNSTGTNGVRLWLGFNCDNTGRTLTLPADGIILEMERVNDAV